ESFGGTETAQGYRALDSHIGLIYGDSITLERAALILEGLRAKRFASSHIVFGIGSYTYQGITRDTFGQAKGIAGDALVGVRADTEDDVGAGEALGAQAFEDQRGALQGDRVAVDQADVGVECAVALRRLGAAEGF